MGKEIILAGVLGDPISHSKSPTLYRYWLEQMNINGHYVPLKISKFNLKQVLETLPKLGFSGVNVTIPHKEAVLKLTENVTERAKKIGSANTLTFLSSGGFEADNTDGYGFLKNLKEKQKNWLASKANVLVIGAGGASRAVIASFIDEGVPSIYITNRTLDRARVLKEYFGSKIKIINWDKKQKHLNKIDTLVNTTALGMVGYERLNLSLDNISKNATVIDLVYNPIKTQLLHDAEIRGCVIIDGLGMLLHQATPGFERWFNARPTIDKETRKQILSR